MNNDTTILRDLAKRYMEIATAQVQDHRRNLWRRQNSLKGERPLIYVRAFAWHEMADNVCLCQEPLLREKESVFRHLLFWHTMDDDSIFEPWLPMPAVYTCAGWGIDMKRITSDVAGGSYKGDYPIKELTDVAKLRSPFHGIDEPATAANAGRLREVIGDIIDITVDRGPYYKMWGGDLSTDLGHLRGIENLMLDMFDNPEWLHRLLGFMSDGVLKTHVQAEAAGDWNLTAHQNQAMPYAEELPDPAANTFGIPRKQLWCYMAAQEYTAVSPAMHEEFMLRYQMPIMREFGLAAYGCCEDLTNKIDMLRQIPNLRRIAVSPFSDVAKCAEQIGDRYVLSYRPSPADMVSYDFNPDRINAILHRDLSACKANGCKVDITLKDVETVGRDPDRVRNWVRLTRKVIDKVYGS